MSFPLTRFRRALILSASTLALALPLNAETMIRGVTLSTAGLAMIEASGTWAAIPSACRLPATISTIF